MGYIQGGGGGGKDANLDCSGALVPVLTAASGGDSPEKTYVCMYGLIGVSHRVCGDWYSIFYSHSCSLVGWAASGLMHMPCIETVPTCMSAISLLLNSSSRHCLNLLLLKGLLILHRGRVMVLSGPVTCPRLASVKMRGWPVFVLSTWPCR